MERIAMNRMNAEKDKHEKNVGRFIFTKLKNFGVRFFMHF